MSGGFSLRPPILKFSFQNPLSCNIKRHRTLCSNSTGGADLGVSSGLATDREVLTQGVMSGGFMSANRLWGGTREGIIAIHVASL